MGTIKFLVLLPERRFKIAAYESERRKVNPYTSVLPPTQLAWNSWLAIDNWARTFSLCGIGPSVNHSTLSNPLGSPIYTE